MSCEIGIDILQPLNSIRRTPQSYDRPTRWKEILKESVEQSERLWIPELKTTIDVSSWWNINKSNVALSYGKTRSKEIQEIYQWMNGFSRNIEEIWITIGPEGGFTSDEESQAVALGWTPVHLGHSILRTSTASVVATQAMSSWRRLCL